MRQSLKLVVEKKSLKEYCATLTELELYCKVCDTVALYFKTVRWLKSVLEEEYNKYELLYFEFKGQKKP